MIRSIILTLLLSISVSACALNNYSRQDNPGLFSALDTQPDGSTGKIEGSGLPFRIVSTKANEARLCRVVAIYSANNFVSKSFCKSRGGEWQ